MWQLNRCGFSSATVMRIASLIGKGFIGRQWLIDLAMSSLVAIS